MRLAILGFGGIGKAFVRLLYDKRSELLKEDLNCKVNYIITSKGGVYNLYGIDLEEMVQFIEEYDGIKDNPNGYSEGISFNTILDNKDVDMVIEVTPTNVVDGEPTISHITQSLEQSFHVVTANKGPILLAYKKLKKLAYKNKVQLGIGCTTGGALPAINGGIMDMAGSKITSIKEMLNGTTNFILDEMEWSTLLP